MNYLFEYSKTDNLMNYDDLLSEYVGDLNQKRKYREKIITRDDVDMSDVKKKEIDSFTKTIYRFIPQKYVKNFKDESKDLGIKYTFEVFDKKISAFKTNRLTRDMMLNYDTYNFYLGRKQIGFTELISELQKTIEGSKTDEELVQDFVEKIKSYDTAIEYIDDSRQYKIVKNHNDAILDKWDNLDSKIKTNIIKELESDRDFNRNKSELENLKRIFKI